MPKRNRMTYKRELDRAIGNIEWAIKHLYNVGDKYAEFHPEIALQTKLMSDALITIGEAISSLNKTI